MSGLRVLQGRTSPVLRHHVLAREGSKENVRSARSALELPIRPVPLGVRAGSGKDTEPWEIIYFKLYKSQLPVMEEALERTALMLGSDK